MLDFRWIVFRSVAKHLSFTKAAGELFITQPAATKRIQELEAEVGLRLFLRKGNRIQLTPAGETLLSFADRSHALQEEMQFALGKLKNQVGGHLRLGASTTIAQYVLAPVLSKFYQRHPQVQLSLANGNTEAIEQALLLQHIDLGIVEGSSHRRELQYTPFLPDELLPVVRAGHPLARKGTITFQELVQQPLVLRERGSGTLEVIEEALRPHYLRLPDLNVVLYLGSSETIKSFLQHSDCVALLSAHAIQLEVEAGKLAVLPPQDFHLARTFWFVQLLGQQEGLAQLFQRFAQRQYNLPE
ncbi:LysR substrate-binding domain-containing protein [Rufibacter quisquiliarum]|uniref:DNA-binding transcriptional LysR family regulator n=1 Tax=Rufibacter quisquiliarum TaxID=1549639 RepID=A0A839GI09_9BACT|nr:LysR substrate-binding domain-containing protein [Rufibacter quisquiliarum]MBA9079284.1 DNA-binding transcriptional LysR family regulator [Rufibacter quisquiliarum]